MSKKWFKYYVLFGTVIMLILSAVCSFAFMKANIDQAEKKHNFESIYLDTDIDFIIPSPSHEQLKDMTAHGIKAVTPYYETSSEIKINGSPVRNTSILMFPDASKMSHTPYNSSRITKGETTLSGGDCTADLMYAEKTGCNIGDSVTINIGGADYSFRLKAISENNTYYSSGTIALVLTEEQADMLNSEGLVYSSAYVSADSYDVCKKYLYDEYKPYGRLKDASVFDSEDIYNKHYDNFMNADWSKEITNCDDNYNSLKVKYDNIDSGIQRNNIINAVIMALAIIIFNIALLSGKSLRQFMRTYLVKGGGTKAKIAGFYTKGIIFNAIIGIIANVGMYYYFAGTSLKYAMNIVYPVGAVFVSSVIMLLISRIVVSCSYSVKTAEKE